MKAAVDLLSVRLHGGGGGGGGGAAAAADDDDEFRERNAIYTWVKFATSTEL